MYLSAFPSPPFKCASLPLLLCMCIFLYTCVRPFFSFDCINSFVLELTSLSAPFFNIYSAYLATFNFVYDGKDLIAKARTGTGKTLSFALPLVERLNQKVSAVRGRAPRILVMAPTRELARQVSGEFEAIAPRLSTLCIYGGSPYETQGDVFKWEFATYS